MGKRNKNVINGEKEERTFMRPAKKKLIGSSKSILIIY